jgi:hypothetical protein
VTRRRHRIDRPGVGRDPYLAAVKARLDHRVVVPRCAGQSRQIIIVDIRRGRGAGPRGHATTTSSPVAATLFEAPTLRPPVFTRNRSAVQPRAFMGDGRATDGRRMDDGWGDGWGNGWDGAGVARRRGRPRNFHMVSRERNRQSDDRGGMIGRRRPCQRKGRAAAAGAEGAGAGWGRGELISRPANSSGLALHRQRQMMLSNANSLSGAAAGAHPTCPANASSLSLSRPVGLSRSLCAPRPRPFFPNLARRDNRFSSLPPFVYPLAPPFTPPLAFLPFSFASPSPKPRRPSPSLRLASVGGEDLYETRRNDVSPRKKPTERIILEAREHFPLRAFDYPLLPRPLIDFQT